MKKTRVLAKKLAIYALSMLLMIGSFSSLAQGQVITTGRISGTVMDPQGAGVPKALVVVRNNETGAEFRTESSEDGTYAVSSLPVGIYSVTVTAQGFKQTVVTNVKTEVGAPSTVDVKLEVGGTNETVTITSGAEVLNKESTNVGSVISGRQITELPFTSRDALDLVLTLPGTATVGRPRSSSVNGLPKGALFISLDGINAQDNFLRSTDGFFTYIRPRIDAIEEVQVSTATPGAEASAGGAVHIRFVTKSGTNQYHGGAWWYNRQRAYNANYYFNNLNGIPRAQVMLNQWGVKVGGPVTPWLKDRVFFFFSYDEFRLPEQTTRTRTILSPDAAAGIFRYPGGPAGGVNVLQLVASRNIPGAPGTPDPLIAKLISDIRASTAKGAVKSQTDPNFQSFTFTNTGGQTRRFPTARFDVNITSKHHFEVIHNFQDFANGVDFLNNADPAFPEPIPQIFGGQDSNRFSLSTALRSQLSTTIVNEARFGLTGGTVLFRPNLSAVDFDVFGGVAPSFNAFTGITVSNPYSTTTFSRRNSPIQQFTDNLSWTKGRHNFNFGGSFTRARSFQQSSSGAVVPTLGFGASSASDPVSSVFSTTTLPGADTTQLANARALYALLTGRISTVTFNAKLDETSQQYSLNGTAIERNSVRGFGFYYQDYFKVRPNLNLNYGLRWEAAFAPRHNNDVYVRPTFKGLFGISGPGNLFNPGASAGAATTYIPIDKETKPFDDDLNNFAPSIGISWSPSFTNSWLKRIFGEGDKTVIRGAYSISYVSGGFADFNTVWNGNPGLSSAVGARGGIEFTPGSLLLRDPATKQKLLRSLPTRTFPVAASPGVPAFDFDPNLTVPYVQSWTFGIQRELTKDTVFEARYIGNHSIGLGRIIDLNEVNIFENGFLAEFLNAQRNLQLSIAAGRGNNFRNQGLAGQVALPIFEKSFGSATSTQFGSSTFTTPISRGEAGAVANLLGNNAGNIAFHNNRVAAGLPANLFIVNPSVLGSDRSSGAFLATNSGSSTYNALQLELRRRLSAGLILNANYTWSHALTDIWPSFQNVQLQSQPHTLRAPGMDKGSSPFDIRHAFKLSYTYDLPFGPGHRLNFGGPGGVIGKIIEGWETDGIIRWQSGRMFPLVSGRATVNQFDSGVVLVGMDAKELQSLVKIRKDPQAANRGTVFWLPEDVILNTQRAFGLKPGETPTGRYIAPPTTPGKFGSYTFLRGPSFFRADLSIVKKTRITERTNVEFRTEFLNAFNNVNFLIGNTTAGNVSSADSYTVSVNTLTFGQTNHAYQDVSTTNDPGGRLLQFVLRFNF